MRKREEKLLITNKTAFPNGYILFELHSASKLEYIVPGQFINVLVEKTNKVFLRRPFSIHFVDYHKNTISFLMKIVGEGTKTLSSLNTGEFMSTLFPLGNGFSVPENKKVLLAGGGYGNAPLYHLGYELIANGNKVQFLLGAKKMDDLVLLEKFRKLSDMAITTEDGSMGFKGLITQHPLFTDSLNLFDYVFTCGPEAMMKAITTIANHNKIECEVSLDQIMGCGIGVCLSCVAKTVRGHEATCLHGPVYNSKDILW